jgi:glycosyltransferase involved in cell wall biosynthesis
MPLLSIVLPTRNRAHLLHYALQSILTQDWDDYELIVSDNDSSDGTKECIDSFSHPRLRYIRPSGYLHVCEHWDFAVRYAQGKYVLMFADDDCLAPKALRTFADVARTTGSPIIGCNLPDYFSPDFPTESLRNTIILPAFTGAVKHIEMRQVLAGSFNFNPVYYPRVPTLILREIVETLQQRFGYFFAIPFPEYVGYAMAFSMAKEYILVDKPLAVLGRTPASLGPSYFWFGSDPAWGEAGKFSFQNTPLKGTFVTNGIAESLLKAKQNLPGNFQGIDLAYDKYYSNYYADMLTLQKVGRDIQREMGEYQRVVASLPEELRNQVEFSVWNAERRDALWFRFIRKIQHTSLRFSLAIQAHVLPHQDRDFSKGGIIRGEQVGVKDILTCASWLAKIA